MRFSEENNGWEYQWLCLLDPSCGYGDGEHCAECVRMNAEREEYQWDRERKDRMERYRLIGIHHR